MTFKLHFLVELNWTFIEPGCPIEGWRPPSQERPEHAITLFTTTLKVHSFPRLSVGGGPMFRYWVFGAQTACWGRQEFTVLSIPSQQWLTTQGSIMIVPPLCQGLLTDEWQPRDQWWLSLPCVKACWLVSENPGINDGCSPTEQSGLNPFLLSICNNLVDDCIHYFSTNPHACTHERMYTHTHIYF